MWRHDLYELLEKRLGPPVAESENQQRPYYAAQEFLQEFSYGFDWTWGSHCFEIIQSPCKLQTQSFVDSKSLSLFLHQDFYPSQHLLLINSLLCGLVYYSFYISSSNQMLQSHKFTAVATRNTFLKPLRSSNVRLTSNHPLFSTIS